MDVYATVVTAGSGIFFFNALLYFEENQATVMKKRSHTNIFIYLIRSVQSLDSSKTDREVETKIMEKRETIPYR